MDIYILDSMFRRNVAIDDYISLVWAERYNELGDFELVIADTTKNRTLFKPKCWLGLDRSKRVMEAHSISYEWRQDDGGHARVIVVKGKSLEYIMTKRVAWGSMSTLGVSPETLYGTPNTLAYWMFVDVCINGVLSQADVLPLCYARTYVGSYNIPEFTAKIKKDVTPDRSVYEYVSDICKTFDYGFALTRDGDDGSVTFTTYNGYDRTSGQTSYPKVIFSQQLDNLERPSYLVDATNSMNIAYVFTKTGNSIVSYDSVDVNISGWDREVIAVDAVDYDPNAVGSETTVRTLGQEVLLNNQTNRAFDGEIRKNSQYLYGRDYFLGDLVEVRSEEGFSNRVRVTEQIFACDREGEREYPTFSVRDVAVADSWLLWKTDRVWADMTTEQWGTITAE